MKKQLLIGTALLVSVSAFSQSGSLRPRPSELINARTIAEAKYVAHEGMPSSIKPVVETSFRPQVKQASKSSSTNTWQGFTASMNIYGVSNSFVKPLQWNDELNAVSFLHRKSPTYVSSPAAAANAENGTIVAMISTDCGESWDSTAIWVNNNFWARFPGGAIYNPPSNTSIDNCYIVGAGPTTGQATTPPWIGNWYASKKIGAGNYNNAPSTAPNAQQLAITAGTPMPNVPRHDFSTYNFTATDDGKMRVLAGVTDEALSPASDTSLVLVTGTFNNGVFDWVGQHFEVPVTENSDGSHNFVSRPMMAWNEAGTIGYIVVMGSRLGATGSNVGYQPIVYKTTNNGQTWSLETVSVDFNGTAFADVKRPLSGITTDSTFKVPQFYFGEGMDCTVDANNKLHIFTTIIGHPSDHMDSLNFINPFTSERYFWPHTPGQQAYLYDFIYDGTNASPSWSHITVDSMMSEGPGALTTSAGYDDNPWDTDPAQANRKFSVDARLQMSRTPDGQYLIYSWTESDPAFTDNQKHWNNLPNIKVRLMDLQSNHLLHYKVDATIDGGGDVAYRAMCQFISPKFKFNSKTAERINITLPMTVSNSKPYKQLDANTHWYSCAQLEFLRPQSSDPENYVGISENSSNGVNASYVYPNPAHTNAMVNINLAASSKVQIEVMNAMGQLIKSIQAEGQAGSNTIAVDISNMPVGIYFVNVKAGNSTSTKKLIVE